MRRLVDRYEEVVLNEISDVGSRYGLSAYPKVRIADVIDLDTLTVDSAHYRFGLMAHFDFIVCRDYQPQYAVEFDGQSHQSRKQKERDAKKDRLCELGDFPILRINSRHLTRDFGDLTLLAWIMETYEMQCGFHEAQENGQIPYDEPFDPFFLMSFDDGKIKYPLWLSRKPRLQLERWFREGLVADFGSCGVYGYDATGVLRGLEFVRVNATHGLAVETAMRAQQFPLMFSDLLGEVLFIQLMDRLKNYLDGTQGLEPLPVIYARVERFKTNYSMAGSHWIGPADSKADAA